MFGVPSERPGDWKFRVLNFPVRVSIWFWLVCLMLGPHSPRGAVMWIGCVFVSILVHEMGHGLVARWFGYRSQLILYGFGGLCVSEADGQTSNQRIAISLGGPIAQFLLLGVVMASGALTLGLGVSDNILLARLFVGLPVKGGISPSGSEMAWELYFYMFQINWLWPLFNLLPIWPLDGGHVCGELLTKVNRREGRRWGHIVSMVLTGALAIYFLTHGSEEQVDTLLRVAFFASIAYLNYQMLQTYQRSRQQYGSDYDRDW
jgi:Zn-dependent protease